MYQNLNLDRVEEEFRIGTGSKYATAHKHASTGTE